jgi:multidrug resistance protein MdtO
LFFTIDASEPALRLALMAAGTFLGFFLVRTSTVGPIGFLAGFVLVLSQTLIDDMPSPEALTRLVLWLWVIVAFPAALTTLVDLAFGRDPAKVALRSALRLLDAATARLRGDGSVDVVRLQSTAIELLELIKHAQMADRRVRAQAAADRRIVETLAELLALLQALPAFVPAQAIAMLAAACEQSRRALAFPNAPLPAPPVLPDALVRDLAADVRPVVLALAGALGRLAVQVADRRRPSSAVDARASTSLFVPDAWTNPEHARFALKTTIAVMASYVIYTLLDWPGIRTAVTTCFFVALGSVGETMHKLTLRIAGALIGGLAAGLCIQYLLPHFTDVGQLALLICVASAAAAWVATSSELLSYAGMQMAFAFFLGVLQGYGPATEVTVLRDRLVGILLGNVLISIAFSVLWPISALDRARAAMARALQVCAELMGDVVHPATDARLNAIQSLVEARRLVSIAVFEGNLLQAHTAGARVDQSMVHRLGRLGAAALVVAGQYNSRQVSDASRMLDAASSSWFADAARRFAAGEAAPAPPDRALVERADTVVSAAAPPARAAFEARLQLQKEIEHAFATSA